MIKPTPTLPYRLHSPSAPNNLTKLERHPAELPGRLAKSQESITINLPLEKVFAPGIAASIMNKSYEIQTFSEGIRVGYDPKVAFIRVFIGEDSYSVNVYLGGDKVTDKGEKVLDNVTEIVSPMADCKSKLATLVEMGFFLDSVLKKA